MRAFVAGIMVASSVVLASAFVEGSVAAGGVPSSDAVAGAGYTGKGAQLTVDSTGTKVTIQSLPVKPKCKNGKTPSNEGDYGSSGLGPFTIAANGAFTNVAGKALPTQSVIKGTFKGSKVSGTITEPAFSDKGFSCKKFSGSWSATKSGAT